MKHNNSDVVLVVDDSPESLGMLNVALNSQGYTALVALNGLQALAIAEKVPPDVVLLDAMMPQMDGFETCRRLKLILPNTPIIFMTGLTDVEDVVKGFEAGGVDYVTKPISPDEVIARIKRHIETAKLALSAQDALDHAGKNVFCVSELGRLSWATPYVHALIEQTSGDNPSPWASMALLIENWLKTDKSQNLKINCFSDQIEVYYERQQENMHLLRIVQKAPQKNPQDLKNKLPITKRESEVLYWVSYGKTSWEISLILEMSPRTVNKHLEQIYKKLGVDNRTSAAAISIRILEA
ncbi:two component transcriptional regulator, LuxR family protein [Psychromonas ingrahamii 37]|uniref:Two component transcriptional regulator, LuxR family protein n=1 Tax=Psychromonas ingrahamii (strain DSM 17664 / CCUG 51855 / 37) TaxID=357804 RepID=A1SYX1_PSYIN|nr:response regulator transcription factor [Psychromonas ingrahamii]ABM04686.1 two component transcriptional regulator, LuxR family protein [Psychromonas ingrahamii 37]